MSKHKLTSLLVMVGMLAAMILSAPLSSTAQGSRTFPETGKTVSGRFLEYWDTNGGLAQQGFPISEEMEEVSDTDGKTYRVQYFERAVFEKHPELEPPYDVLLSLLGTFYYNDKYSGEAPDQLASTDNPMTFPETGKTIGGVFRTYWETHGGLAQQGFPISDEFEEVSDTDGNTYRVQYFERAVFEYHPEFAGTEYEVQLSLLGVFFHNSKHGTIGGPSLVGPGTPGTSTSAEASDLFRPGWTHLAGATNDVVLFYNEVTGKATTARIRADGTLTPLQTFGRTAGQAALLPTGASHLLAGPNSIFYLYDTESGLATVASVDNDGLLTIVRTEEWQPGWSAMGIDIEAGMRAFYNDSNDRLETSPVKEDGLFSESDTTFVSWESVPGLTDLVPVGDGMWIAYGVAGETGTFQTLELSEDGEVSELETNATFSPRWTEVLSDGSNVLFYSKVDETALTGKVEADGSFTQLRTYASWSTWWGPVISAKNAVLIFYDASVGTIYTDRLNADGSYTDLKDYGPVAPKSELAKPGWTHVAVATNNIALFYNTNNGDASTARVDADGTLTLLADKSKLGQYVLGWTHIVPGPQNTLIFYNLSTGTISLSRVDEDGIVQPIAIYDPISPTWSIISMDSVTGMMVFYSTLDGAQTIGQLKPETRELLPLNTTPGTLTPTEVRRSHYVPVGDGIWFWFTARIGSGFTMRFTPSGDIEPLMAYTGFDMTWSNIVSNGDFLYFYDKTNGKAMTAAVAPDSGKFSILKTYPGLSTSWTNFTATPSGPFLIYSTETGRIATDRIDENGNVVALLRYEP